MAKTYIIKTQYGPRLADLEGVSYRDRMKKGRVLDLPGFGKIQTRKATGKVIKNKLDLWTSAGNYGVNATHEDVRARIRRVRPEEAALIDAIDAQIGELRAKRKELELEAWSRAHTVTVKELSEIAEAKANKNSSHEKTGEP